MSMLREAAQDLAPAKSPPPLVLTVDHWLIVGPILAAIFIIAGLIGMI